MNTLMQGLIYNWPDILTATFVFVVSLFVNKNLQDNYYTKEEIGKEIDSKIMKHEKECSNNCELKEMIKEIFSQIKEINEKLYSIVANKEK